MSFDGRHKMLLGLFITTFHFPGIPLLSWGDEQAFYVLDSTAENYLFGRQPMTSSIAWQMHGCYQLNSSVYYHMPLSSARTGCYDDGISLDHRDPSHPIRSILKIMNKRREEYPTLKDGWFLEQLSNQTRHETLPGSSDLPTEFGLWSTVRDEFAPFQNLSASPARNEPSWLIYHNEANHTDYSQGCIASPFDYGTEVKNLLFLYDEYTVGKLHQDEMVEVSKRVKGCIRQMELRPFEFKALVTKISWVPPPPVITKFLPGHDSRIEAQASPGISDTLDISFSFSTEMDCAKLTTAISLSSETENGIVANIQPASIHCNAEPDNSVPEHVGQPASAFTWKATLENMYPGIHSITIRNATTKGSLQFTDSNDRFLFRVGLRDNPMVFPQQAMFPNNMLSRRGDNNSLEITLYAPGANKWRYSLNWGASWTAWKTYSSGYHVMDASEQESWTGTANQAWEGQLILVQYWSKMAGSSSVVQHAGIESSEAESRVFPHIFAHGDFNLHGHDRSVASKAAFDGEWKFHFMGEWPDGFSLNVWGVNADGEQDLSFVYGDVDRNNVLDRWIPSMLSKVAIPFDRPPPYPYLACEFALPRDFYRYELRPKGNRWHQILLMLIFLLVPPTSGIIGLRVYRTRYCRIVLNHHGSSDNTKHGVQRALVDTLPSNIPKRRVLIATVEYDIPDCNIDIRLGGLGTMSTLMGRHLTEYDLIWVIPCVSGISYPQNNAGKPILAYVCGRKVKVQVYCHTLKSVTYVMLDSPNLQKPNKSTAVSYPHGRHAERSLLAAFHIWRRRFCFDPIERRAIRSCRRTIWEKRCFGSRSGNTFMLMLGQMLSMNSLQLGILVGTISQDESTLYTIGSIYAATSVLWWVLHQRLQTLQVICLPFLVYACSFLLLAGILLSNSASVSGRLWQLVQVLYVCGASSGSIYFAMNFVEDSSPIESWIDRAALISGIQYGYQALLWYSARRILRSIALTGQASAGNILYWFGALAFILGHGLIFVYGLLMAGLPTLYRRVPGHIPKFYSSLVRRPVSMHYLFSTFVQSISLSAPLMAQSWLFLFSSRHAPDFIIGFLVMFAIISYMCLARRGAQYSVLHGHWILPVVSFTSSCIIHPRWAQLFWSISRTGLSIPWVLIPYYLENRLQMVYSPLLSAVIIRSLWLYLGVFDLLVGIGNGLALMQTLPRQHVLFVSILAQVVGSVGMMVSRAKILAQEDGHAGLVEGLKILPQVFPDMSKDTTASCAFWGIFVLQSSVALGWMRWFQGAQLQKP